jgi:hypothetical protein
MTVIKLEEAIGRPLAHDLTKIDAKTGVKGARFKKGQIVTEDDLPVLRDMGREHLSILELEPGETHEDDAAEALCAALRGENCAASAPSEGRITLRAERDGLLMYDPEMISRVNEDPDWVLAALAPQRQVRKRQPVAGFRIRPLFMTRDRVERAVSAAGRIDVLPFAPLRAGLVTVGTEIASGRIDDAFGEKFKNKIAVFGGSVIGQKFSTDDSALIASAIMEFMDDGAEIVVCTGGMSVDADDRTPGGISLAASRIAFHGVPVLPGGMLMMAWAESGGRDVPVIGAPACVVHDERTALDRLLPFLFAGADPAPYTRSWGAGGLCEGCSPCHWPECRFSSGA